MARLPRLTLSGYPHHVILRGNNRQAIALDAADFEYLHALLGSSAQRHSVALHGYVLMANHFHLLATPATAQGLPAMMQTLGRHYVRYFNDRYQRSGTLWEGRYRSTVLEPQPYLLPCMVYLDLNPVRAGLAASAADYPWSSHAHYSGRRVDKWLSPHPLVWGLGNTPFAREAAYAQLVHDGLGASLQTALTDTALRGWALGSAGFLQELQQQTPRRVTPNRPGRPPLVPKKQVK
ncbi:MAG: transposase [Rhodoferax sp.]|nr:transposase [Rhodoferax sp.]